MMDLDGAEREFVEVLDAACDLTPEEHDELLVFLDAVLAAFIATDNAAATARDAIKVRNLLPAAHGGLSKS